MKKSFGLIFHLLTQTEEQFDIKMSSGKGNNAESDLKNSKEADNLISAMDWKNEMNVEFDPSPLGLGIHNAKSDCFMISSIQALAHCTPVFQ